MTTTDVNYPGFRSITGQVDEMREQSAAIHGADLRMEDVESVSLHRPLKIGRHADRQTHRARAVILAMGAAARYLQVPGEQELLEARGELVRLRRILLPRSRTSPSSAAVTRQWRSYLPIDSLAVSAVASPATVPGFKTVLDRAHPATTECRFLTNHTQGQGHHSDRLAGATPTPVPKPPLPVTGVFVLIRPRAAAGPGAQAIDVGRTATCWCRGRTTSTSHRACSRGDLVDRTIARRFTTAAVAAPRLSAPARLAEHPSNRRSGSTDALIEL